jgi:hypothetical protein
MGEVGRGGGVKGSGDREVSEVKEVKEVKERK